MDKKVTVTYRGEKVEYPEGTTLLKVAEEFQKNYEYPIVLAEENGKLRELFHKVEDGSELEFKTLSDSAGHKAYKRSICLLLIKSFYDVVGGEKMEKFKVEFSIGAGYYCTVRGNFELTDELTDKVRARMKELVEKDLPINKKTYPMDEVRKFCEESRMTDKSRLFHYRMSSTVNLYSINDFKDYYYGFMVPSTGYLKYFDLQHYEDGLLVQMPERKAPLEVPPIKNMPHLFNTMMEATRWNAVMGIETVGDLNDAISSGKMNQLILVQEALMESRIASIAEDVIRKNKKFVMIAGPSSSGKTTFSHRLAIQLAAHGMKPHTIGLDDYFVNRENTPLDADGKKDYECLEALDIEIFNEHMNALLNGKRVEMPKYNFITGEREYKGDFLEMGKEDVLVIEGIHGLNDRLSYSLPRESKYKIYISALTTLNVDEHNRIPTTDGRLIRRIVRDYRTRGASASRTLGMWGSVRRGEETNIFPFQEEADAMFNSALIYELSVLKQYAEPLLFSIEPSDPGYQEAVRLLKFLQYFLGISTEDLPKNSLVREFVGGSYFEVG
ncbi:uridine kinase [Lachnospiraceae bacterium]|nr:uridine kinase [Lachnospiraceae bacterium]